jgi:hypothetical protein
MAGASRTTMPRASRESNRSTVVQVQLDGHRVQFDPGAQVQLGRLMYRFNPSTSSLLAYRLPRPHVHSGGQMQPVVQAQLDSAYRRMVMRLGNRHRWRTGSPPDPRRTGSAWRATKAQLGTYVQGRVGAARRRRAVHRLSVCGKLGEAQHPELDRRTGAV